MPEPPLRPTIVTGSATLEGIVKHLPELRASLGIMTDEGGQRIGGYSMREENKLYALATLAAMWDGATLDRWRAGDGVASYAGRRFSSNLLIQPKAAEAFLADPLANGQGLLARFLTARPKSNIGGRVRFSRSATAQAEIDRFATEIEALLSRPLSLAQDRRNELSLPVMTLASGARDRLTDFARRIELDQADGGAFADSRAFASKTAEHAARLAGVMTLFADPEAGTVTGETIANALELAGFYVKEAARLQNAVVIPPHVSDAERMRHWLVNSWKEDFISAAIASQRSPIRNTPDARKALKLLAEHGWVSPAPGATVLGATRREAWRVVRAGR